MFCSHCRSEAFAKKVTRRYFITIPKKGRMKRAKKIVVWTETDTVIICHSCQKRAANEQQKRDTVKAWNAYMRKNPEYKRQLEAPRRSV